MSETNQRKAWIDVFKSIAILLVVIAHHPMVTQKLFNIATLSIPLFFFISGYLFDPDVTLSGLLKRRFDSILKPYLVTLILISIIYIIFKDKPFFLWYLFWTIYGNGPNLTKLALHLWFLPSLYVTTVFVWFAFKYIHTLKNSLIIQFLFICGLFICGSFVIHIFWDLKIPLAITNFFAEDGHRFIINGLLDNPNYPKAQLLNDNQFMLKGLPWSLDSIFLTAAFFISGYAVKRNKLEEFFHKHAPALIMLFIFCTLHYYYNCEINFNDRRYDNLLLCTGVAFAGIYASMYVSNAIGNWDNRMNKVLQYIGKYSLVIFIFHPIVQGKVYQDILALLPNTAYIAILPAFAAGICLPLLLNYLLLERFKFFRFWYYAR